MPSPSFRAADVASTSPKYELGKVAFGLMFLMGIKSQCSGASSFPNFYYTLQKNPFATLTTQIYQIRPSCD